MKVKPLGDRIVVRRQEASEKTAGGILLPDAAKDKPQKGKVLAVGPGRLTKDGKYTALDVKVGDVVLFTNWAGDEFKQAQGENVLLMRIDDIQGRLDDCFTYPGGQTVHPLTFRSPLGRERDIIEYQVCQTARGADVRVRCQGPIDTARIAETIRGALADVGLTGAEVSVTPVDALSRQSTGKLRRFVPLAGAA